MAIMHSVFFLHKEAMPEPIRRENELSSYEVCMLWQSHPIDCVSVSLDQSMQLTRTTLPHGQSLPPLHS